MNSVNRYAHPWTLAAILMAAMALPMLILYACGALAPYILREGEITAQQLAGFTFASFSVAACCSLTAGRWVKFLGVEKAAFSLFCLTALALTLLFWARDLRVMLLAIAICGVAQALANPMTNMAIATQVAAPRKSLLVGVKQSGVQFAALVAGSGLSWIAEFWGWRVAMLTLVPVCGVFMLMVWLYPWQPESPVVAHGVKRGPAIPGLLGLVMWMQGLVGVVIAAYVTQVPVIATSVGLSSANAALTITLFGLAGMFSRLILTPVANRVSQQSDVLMALIGIAIVALVITFNAQPSTTWMIYFGAAGIGCTLVATNALVMAMIIKQAAFGEIATASGRVSAGFFFGLAIGAPLFRKAVDHFNSMHAGLALLSVILLASLGCLWSLRSRLRYARLTDGRS